MGRQMEDPFGSQIADDTTQLIRIAEIDDMATSIVADAGDSPGRMCGAEQQMHLVPFLE